MSQKRKRSPSPDLAQAETVDYYRSRIVEDRQSKFIGFYSPSLPYKDLQRLDEIKSATHKIAAWRRESNQQSLSATKRYVTGFDDDREKYGGKKIEQALVHAAVTGSCVVARWWGGIMLGPTRFEHIDTCAREAIQSWKDSVAETFEKKRRLELDEAEKRRLVDALKGRDTNIAILRSLAAQKDRALEDARAGRPACEEHQVRRTPPMPASPALAYDSMPLEKLKALERARDATVSFLLKRIDKAEADLERLKG